MTNFLELRTAIFFLVAYASLWKVEASVQRRDHADAKNPSLHDPTVNLMKQLKAQMNLTADPCTDFYEYACGNSKSEDIVLLRMLKAHLSELVNRTETLELDTTMSGLRNKAVMYYKSCILARANENKRKDAEDMVKMLMGVLRNTGFVFLGNLSAPAAHELDAKVFSRTLGVLSHFGIHTLITPEPSNVSDLMVVFNHSTLIRDFPFYLDNNRSRVEDECQKLVHETVESYLNLFQDVDNVPESLGPRMEDFLNLEEHIALLYTEQLNSTDSAKRSIDRILTNNETIPFFDIGSYVEGFHCGVKKMCYSPQVQISVVAPTALNQVFRIVETLQPQVIMDYLFWRVLLSKSEQLLQQTLECDKDEDQYGYQPDDENEDTDEDEGEGISRRQTKFGEHWVAKDDKLKCYVELLDGLHPFLYLLEPASNTPEEARTIKNVAQKIFANIRSSMANMLSRPFAGYKRVAERMRAMMKQLKLIIHFPEQAYEPMLDFYYRHLQFEHSDSFCKMKEKLKKFKEVKKSINANDTYVNSLHHDPTHNRMTHEISMAWFLLVEPAFSKDWPIPAQYGNLGSVIGHELTHGFQSAGWWKNDESSLAREVGLKFKRMKKCLVEQYSRYCVLEAGDNGKLLCVNGNKTAAENTCDNIGLVAAYEAYKHALSRSDEQQRPLDSYASYLPELTQDKLFFLSFARFWCAKSLNKQQLKNWISRDVHSPYKYRVLGTFTNFPAFRQAFNCPAQPQEENVTRCDIW